jgi:hypothetical protein
MRKRTPLTLIISLAALLILSACSTGGETSDWKVFTIEQEPAFNIEFRLPPNWLVDFAPIRDKPGQWEVTLVPPRCLPDQGFDYQQNCVRLIAHVKGVSTFSEEAFFDLTSGDIPLSQDGTTSALLLSEESYRVNRIKVDRFNHLIKTGAGEVQMSTYFFETDSAYYTFITNFPYGVEENEAIDNFKLLLGSVRKTN